MSELKFDAVIFDLGGVLIDWNPRYLYNKIFDDDEKVTWFLENVCTSEWNDQQDAGRSFDEATEELITRHPEWEVPIRAWYGRWQETIGGPIEGTVEILRQIRDAGNVRLYALTNWSSETFPWALANFEFLHWFEGIVVSGVEKTRKPFPGFYRVLFERYNLAPGRALFIDDNLRNVKGAEEVGLHAVAFRDPIDLRAQLTRLGIIS